jgi:predicted lipid carrier protein YhbT
LASKEEVEERLAELIDQLGNDEDAARAIDGSLSEPRILTLHVTDLDARYWAELADGRLSPLVEGEPEEAHIRLSARSDDLLDILDGGGNVLNAFVSGRVRIKASFSDLLKLRRLA